MRNRFTLKPARSDDEAADLVTGAQCRGEPAETPQPTGLLARDITDEIKHPTEEHPEVSTASNHFYRRSVKLREMISPLRTQISYLGTIQLFQESAIVATVAEVCIKWAPFHGQRNPSNFQRT